MKRFSNLSRVLFSAALFSAALGAGAQGNTPATPSGTPTVLTIDAGNRKGAKIPSTMYGIFFEDINFGADGGLYAEKVVNRSFEYPDPLMCWSTTGNVRVRDNGPFPR